MTGFFRARISACAFLADSGSGVSMALGLS
jgi:hypothetical protein